MSLISLIEIKIWLIYLEAPKFLSGYTEEKKKTKQFTRIKFTIYTLQAFF